MLQSFLRNYSLCVVILEHFVEQVQSLLTAKVLVFGLNKFTPWLYGVLPNDLIVVIVELDVVLL